MKNNISPIVKIENDTINNNFLNLQEIIIKNNHELLIKESEYIVKELSNPLSKSKLTKMHLEELQKLCADRGLSAEGYKADLINRLLGIARE